MKITLREKLTMRRRSIWTVATATALLAADSGLGQTGQQLAEPTVSGCVVTLKSDVDVPAQDAGVLASLEVVEGTEVEKGYPLGGIDDTEPQMQRRIAEYQREAAAKEASNDVSVRYAVSAARVAKATVSEREAANAKVPGTVTQEEMRRLILDHERSVLSIEQAQFELALAKITAQSKAAEVEAADKKLARHQIRAPISGQVVALLKHAGEWVSPGDTILRIVNLETLRIDAFLNAAEYDPGEVDRRPVTVDVELARGRSVQLSGRVVYVNPLVGVGGYPVWAEVVNRKENGQWLLRPGLIASMTIHVNSPIEAGSLPAASNGSARREVTGSRSSRR
jgi:multidrug resistance efflux pump